MKHLIIVRHGDCSFLTDKLTQAGHNHVVSIVKKIQSMVSGTMVVLTSDAKRPRQSAMIFAELFRCQVHHESWLYCDNETYLNFGAVLNLVRQYAGQADVLVLVTHQEYTDAFPAHFCHYELGVTPDYPSIAKGEALLIDCMAKTITHIRPD